LNTYYGTVFKMTPTGTLTTLDSFDYNNNGGYPEAGLVQASNGQLYGTTYQGGIYGYGTIFRMTPAGALTTLDSLDLDGSSQAPLIQATDGYLYGTGSNAIFRITPKGRIAIIYSFGEAEQYGANGLVQATDGNFYGSTQSGGSGFGTVFKLSVGLGPFVEALPALGKVGADVKILGTNLTGATSVTFNGTVATFAVVSATEIKTTVPTGATTGTVQVTLPGGTLLSNVAFKVRP